MAGSSSTATSVGSAPPVPQLDPPNLMISTVKLNGQNFMEWSLSTKITLASRGKMKYINGTKSPPSTTDPGYEVWEIENYSVMTMLLHSMEREISRTYLLLPIARDIWLAVQKAYSKVGFTSQIFQLKRRIDKFNQGTLSVTDYYTTLKGYFIELDLYQTIEMETQKDIASVKDMFEKERVYKFLLGLNLEFEQVCDRVLGREIFPDLDQAFSLVKGSESQKELFNKPNGGLIGAVEASAFAITKPTYISRDNRKHAEKDTRWCDFCKKPRHTRETC